MLKIAIQAIRKTQQYAINEFNSIKLFKIKPDKSLLTQADLDIENQIRQFLSVKTPNIPILGEEFDSLINNKFHNGWIIDPIDGTRAFLYGVPLFSTLISYIENDEPIIGVISFPALNKIVYASKGKGCWIQYKNDTPIKLNLTSVNRKTLRNSVISFSGIHGTTFNASEGIKAYNLSNVLQIARDLIFINDCYQHIMVTMQRIDAAIDTIMKPWDIAAILPCMQEAGVICADINGSQNKLLWSKSLITSTSQSLLDELIHALN